MNRNETKTSIQPSVITTAKTVSKFSVNIKDVVLFTSATIMVFCYDDNNNLVDIKRLTLDKTNGYDDWKNDDTFVLTWVEKQLGFVAV